MTSISITGHFVELKSVNPEAQAVGLELYRLFQTDPEPLKLKP